jgi:hypothetical protein
VNVNFGRLLKFKIFHRKNNVLVLIKWTRLHFGQLFSTNSNDEQSVDLNGNVLRMFLFQSTITHVYRYALVIRYLGTYVIEKPFTTLKSEINLGAVVLVGVDVEPQVAVLPEHGVRGQEVVDPLRRLHRLPRSQLYFITQ